MKRRSVRIGISLLFSAVCLGFAVRGVNWAEAFAALGSAHYITVIPIVLFTFWTLYIRAQRWRLFLRPVGHPAMRTLVAATNIGFMANMVLPLRIGEVIRPVLVNRREHVPLSGVLATVVLERIFDMFTVILMLGLAGVFLPVSPQVRAWGFRITGVAVLIAAGLALLRWQEERMLRLIRAILGLAPTAVSQPIDQFLGGFIQALEILDTPAAFVGAMLWSFYLWGAIAAVNAVGFFTFDLPVPVILGTIAVTPIIAIAVSVPSAPGYIGAYQLGCTLALALFGIGESRAIAYSIVMHVTQFVATISAGVYSLWKEGMSLRDVEAVSEKSDVAA